MDSGQVSQTALTAAAARAAHLIVDDEPWIHEDRLAQPLLGELAGTFLSYHREHGSHLVLAGARAQVVTRSRYAEDSLARRLRQGIRQYVILGAGLDSFAYRSAGESATVFEVDHPATQEWKRHHLAGAGIAIPRRLAFVPLDSETDSLTERLTVAGFDPCTPAFISWLGVTMYLSRGAISRTLAEIGALAPGTELVIDHLLPEHARDADGNAYAQQVMPVAAAQGEPWRTCLSPSELGSLLADHGLRVAEQVGQREAIAPALWDRSDSLHPFELWMLARAIVSGPGTSP